MNKTGIKQRRRNNRDKVRILILRYSEKRVALNTTWWGSSVAIIAGNLSQSVFYRLNLAESEGKRSEMKIRLDSLWFLTGLVNPKRPKPNLGFGWANERWEWSLPEFSFIKADLQRIGLHLLYIKGSREKTNGKRKGVTVSNKGPNGYGRESVNPS